MSSDDADKKLQTRAWLLRNNQCPNETEIRTEVGNILASAILLTLSPQAKELIVVHEEQPSTVRIDKNVPVSVTHQTILDLGPIIERKFDNETKELIRENNHQQMEELKEEFCNELNERISEEANMGSQQRVEIETENLEYLYKANTEMMNYFEELRSISSTRIEQDFQAIEDDIIQLVVQDVRDRMRADHETILKNELHKQQKEFEKIQQDRLEEVAAENKKTMIDFVKEYNQHLIEYKTHLNICEHFKIFQEKNVIRAKSKETLKSLQKKFDQENLEIIEKIIHMMNNPVKTKKCCPNVNVWKRRCLNLLQKYENYIQRSTNAVPGQGQFFLTFENLIENPESQNLHSNPFHECIYISGRQANFRRAYTIEDIFNVSKYSIDSILWDIVDECLVKSRDKLKTCEFLGYTELCPEMVLEKVNISTENNENTEINENNEINDNTEIDENADINDNTEIDECTDINENIKSIFDTPLEIKNLLKLYLLKSKNDKIIPKIFGVQ